MHARHLARLCAGLLLVTTVTSTAPADAVARADGWSRPHVLEPREGAAAQAPTYASNGSGRTVVAWTSSTVVAPPPEPWEDPVVRTDIRVGRVGRDGRLG